VRALDFVDHKARLHRSLREHYGTVELTESPTPSEIAQAIARCHASGHLIMTDTIQPHRPQESECLRMKYCLL
jgi:methylated-DNA-[protein]-cysteine S-methyltransferase